MENALDDERSGEQVGEQGTAVGNNGNDSQPEPVAQQDGVLIQPLCTGGCDEFGLHHPEHSLPHEAGDAARVIQAEGDDRENRVGRGLPQGNREQVALDAQKEDQERAQDKGRYANHEYGKKAPGIILPPSAPHGALIANRNSDTQGQAEGKPPERQGDRQRLTDDVVHRMVPVFEGRSQVPVREVAEKSQILFPDRFIEMIFRLQLPFDLRRCGFALSIKRAAGGDAHQEKGEEADGQQEGQGE